MDSLCGWIQTGHYLWPRILTGLGIKQSFNQSGLVYNKISHAIRKANLLNSFDLGR
jgi:hypothetical protein